MITDAGIQERPSSAWTVWVSIKSPGQGPMKLEAVLGGGEAGADIMESLLRTGPKGGYGKPVEDAVKGFVEDLMAAFGESGTFFPPSEGPEKLDAFMKRLSERVFRDCLAEHKVAEKLSYEQALLILQEIYVVNPIMSS